MTHANLSLKNYYFSLFFFAILFIVLVPVSSFSQGWIIPERIPTIQQSDRFELEEQSISAKLVDQVASYEIEQTFCNKSNRQIEGIFYFPLPKGSQITGFTYVVNGKEMKGELLEKEKARKIYKDIVSKFRDPALLEYMHQDLFRASIFPVPAGKTCGIEIKFAQILSRQDQFYRLQYPLFQKKHGHRIKPFSPDAKLTVDLELKSEKGIQHIYSPSHNFDIIRENQRHVKASFEGKIESISKNRLELFYELGSDEVGISVLNHRMKGEDGFFLFIASPEFNLDNKKRQSKDVIFVLDVSGSMTGEKIDQAKDALIYCLDRLNPEDRFNIIPFSTAPQSFEKELQPISKKNEAKNFINDLSARGGTNIYEALTFALDQNQNSDRLFAVIFLTDGLPTLGITGENEILQKLIGQDKNNVRIFSFGVGYDVNTFLIDQLASKTNAISDYVKPDENIEMVVSSFYDKISSPVLTQVELDWEDVSVTEVYPRKLPDLFKGGEIIVLGRYESSGKGEVILKGKRDSESFQYASNITLPSSNSENDFIPILWAARKIGYLLDEIRLKGDNKELSNEIVRLSKKYGIVTPYTSYLAQEDDPIFAGIRPLLRRIQPNAQAPQKQTNRKKNAQILYTEANNLKTGKEAVDASIMIQNMKTTTNIGLPILESVQQVAGRLFVFENEVWCEKELDKSLEVLKIKYGSEAYFNLFDLNSEIMDILSVGDKIEFSFADLIIRIGEEGESDLSKKDLRKKLKL